MNWKRIAGWSALIFFAVNIIGFCSGLVMAARWEIYGPTIQIAIDNARLVRRTVIVVVAALLYWRFALGVAKHRLLHVIAVFVGFQLLGIALDLATPPHTVGFELWGLARAFAAALVGWALATWTSRRPAASSPPGDPA